jgi:predicted O-linked N-acetylglucosamine transferase (SPINDLY family)
MTMAGAPLAWPRRAAGDALRVHVLIPPSDAEASRALAFLEHVASDVGDVAWTLVAPGAVAASAGERLRAVVRPLPARFDAPLAAAIARDAPDVLLDLAGLALASGPVLALRPAGEIVGVPVAGPSHAPPLVDAVLAPDAKAFAVWLRQAVSRARARPQSALDAATLAETFDRAVDAHRAGRAEEAVALYGEIVAAQPEHAPSLHLLAALERETGNVDAAAALLTRAIAGAPSFAEARAAAARVARDRDDVEAGLAIVSDGLATEPRAADLWRVRGELELARHDGVAAEAAFAQALALRPTDAEAHYNLGVALQKQGRRSDAARAYQRALAFDAGFADAHFNLAVLFQEGGAADAAVAAYRAVLERDPTRVAAYRNLGEVLLAAGRVDDWLANFARFEARCPDALPLAVQALEACQYAADVPKLERYLEGLRAERFKARDAVELVDALEQLLYLLLFFDVEAETIHRFARTYAETAPKVYGAPLPRPATRRPGRIRIGYLSADLRNHVMGKMMWQAVQHHDRERFSLHCYSLSAAHDEWTERFAGISDAFVVLAGLSERDAAARIAADDLDLLVDLSGHTKGGKPGILARKPARVQVTHVASAGSVGLDTVDFKLTDRFADVASNQDAMIETLLPMDGCVYPYRHVDPAGAHPFHRAALGIAADAIVLGTFVAPMKLSRRCLALWRDVLARLPRAVLAFSPTHPALRPVFERLAAAAGIARERFVFVPQGRNDAENQARYALVDFVLDPMPFGGVNGVIEPLDAGVPVVTLLGKRHGERSAYTILSNLGVTSTVAEGGREYVDIAVRLAEDGAFLREVKDAIRAGLAQSPLVDMAAHARHLEAAYLAALAERAPEALAERSGA